MAFSLLNLNNKFIEWLMRTNEVMTYLNGIMVGTNQIANTAISGRLLTVNSSHPSIVVTGGNPQQGNTVTIGVGTLSSNILDNSTSNIASANLVNSVYNYSNGLSIQSNTKIAIVNDQANGAFNQANAAYNQANTARNSSNSVWQMAQDNIATSYAQANAAYNRANTSVVALSDIVGIVVPYAGSTAPTGWLFCYGQAISRSTYSTLFSVIGTTYGAGNGSSTFNIPDMREVTPVGKADMGGSSKRLLNNTFGNTANNLGTISGTDTVTLTEAQIPVHRHLVSIPSFNSGGAGGHNHNISGTAAGYTQDSGEHNHRVVIGGPNSRSGTASGSNNGNYWRGNPPRDEGYGTENSGIHKHYVSLSVSGSTSTNPGNHVHQISPPETQSANTGSGQAHPNIQPSIILNYIIKAQ